jgi:hypothetical protein
VRLSFLRGAFGGDIRGAFGGDRSRVFTGKLIRKKASAELSPALLFPVPHVGGSTKTLKIVVRMQHTLTTFIKMVRTPKKAAHACLFCFTIVPSQITV